MAERKTVKTTSTPVVSPNVRGIAMAAMIVGIIAVVFFWLPIWGFIISAVGLALGIVGLVKHAPNHGMALAGTILGGIGVLLNILFVVFFIGLVLFSGNTDNSNYYHAQSYYDNY